MFAASAISASFGCLIGRHEAVDRYHPADQRQLGEPLRRGAAAPAAFGVRMSIVNGFVTGDSIRSSRVRIASVCRVLRVQAVGIEAEARQQGDSQQPRDPENASNSQRWRRMNRSSGAAQPKPIEAACSLGRNRVMAAGRNSMVQRKAISIPTPGDQPQLRHAVEVGGHESEEPGRGCRGGDEDLPPDPPAGLRHRGAGAGIAEPHSR